MKARKFLAVTALALCALAACRLQKNPLSGGVWKFVYTEGDYTVFSFSDAFFCVTDYRVSDGRTMFCEVTGSYQKDGSRIVMRGESGKIFADGKESAAAPLKGGWDGEYTFLVTEDGDLELTRGGVTVSLKRAQ